MASGDGNGSQRPLSPAAKRPPSLHRSSSAAVIQLAPPPKRGSANKLHRSSTDCNEIRAYTKLTEIQQTSAASRNTLQLPTKKQSFDTLGRGSINHHALKSSIRLSDFQQMVAVRQISTDTTDKTDEHPNIGATPASVDTRNELSDVGSRDLDVFLV